MRDHLPVYNIGT